MKCSHFLFSTVFFFAFPPCLTSLFAADAGPTYTATAMLLIGRTPPHYFETSKQKFDPAEFEAYKLTQAELVKSPFVIMAALRNTPEIIKKQPQALPSLRREEQNHHAVAWLTKKLRVKFPSPGSEVMKVSLTLPDAEEAATLVNAVIKSYFDEVVNSERYQKKLRYSDLQSFSAESENALRTKRTELRQLAENLGASDTKQSGLAETLENQMCVQIQAELQRMKFEFAARKRRISELVRLQEQNQDEEIAPTEWAAFLQQTSTEYRDLLQKKNYLEAVVRQGTKYLNNANSDHYPPSLAASADELANTTNRIDELRKDGIAQVRIERRIAMDRELKQLRTDEQIWTQQIGEVSVELEARTRAAQEKSRTSIDVQMKRAEIDNLERLLQSVNIEKDRLRIELKAAPRVEIAGDQNNPATVPESPDEPKKKK